MKIIITGGAGYIGSHTVLEALKRGHRVLVIDNLERGYLEALERVERLSGIKPEFIKADLRNAEEINKIIEDFLPECAIHFAAYKSVGESEQKPDMYYENNVKATENLLLALIKNNTKKIIFSSTAAVYNPEQELPFTENSEMSPISVYGKTKAEMENLISDYAEKYGMEAIAFRYFNAVGNDDSGEIGEDPRSSTNLLPIVMQVLTGKREQVQLFGDNFNTEDGSQERDYIHVSDLASAHITAAETTLETGRMYIMNLSTGKPTSCKKVFEIAEKESGKKLNYQVVEPRAGDPERSYASNSLAKETLGWEPTRTIEVSIRDQWRWASNNPEGYKY